MAVKLAQFRIYLPRRSGRGFWDVLIFRTANEMREHLGSEKMRGGAKKKNGRTLGYCQALTKLYRRGGYRPNPRGSRGQVILCLSACGVGIVSHELTHAAHFELASHQGMNPFKLKDHEKLAFLQGEMVRRFWNAFYRRFRQRGRTWQLLSAA